MLPCYWLLLATMRLITAMQLLARKPLIGGMGLPQVQQELKADGGALSSLPDALLPLNLTNLHFTKTTELKNNRTKAHEHHKEPQVRENNDRQKLAYPRNSAHLNH